MKTISVLLLLFLCCQTVVSQQPSQTDSNTPLDLLKPNYPVPYGIAKSEEIAAVLRRVHGYLDEVTPAAFVNSQTRDVLSDLTRIDENTILQPGDFRIVSYEWGVTSATSQSPCKRAGFISIGFRILASAFRSARLLPGNVSYGDLHLWFLRAPSIAVGLTRLLLVR